MKTCKSGKIIFTLLLAAVTLYASAQQSKDQALQDSVFAWGAYTPLKPSAYPRTFTPYQQKLPDIFMQWIRKSYMPIGAIDNTFAIAEPNKKEDINPYVVGINAEMWSTMWDKTGKKVVKVPHSANPIYILTNHIIDAQPVRMLTLPGRPVFMRRSPEIEKAFLGSSERRNQLVKQLQLEKHPQIGKYTIQYYGCDGDGCQPRVAVYLAPGNQLPIRQLTRGEVLERIEQAIPSEITVAKNKLKSTFGHRPESLQEEYKRFDETVLPKWKANLEKLKKQYGNTRNMPAEFRDGNGIEMVHIFNGDDIFADENWVKKQNTYGIYTYKDGILEKSKQDQPLWICISWMPADMNHSFYAREIHRSMITHFNFDYAYNYFFAPEKNNNQPYTLLNAEAQKQNIAHLKTEKSRRNAPAAPTSAGVHYADDFSANNAGQKPQGWYFNNTGEPSLVVVPDGLTGKWLDVRTPQYLLPANFKRPLPKDFQFEFDVACSDFTTNTGGALQLNINNKIRTPNGEETDSPNPVNIDFKITAGHTKWTTNPTGSNSLLATYKGIPGNIRYAGVVKPDLDFTNKKNKVHITITKKGNQVKGFVDNKEITVLDKYGKAIPGYNELPPGTQLNSFHFRNITNGKENRVYISNVKITAL